MASAYKPGNTANEKYISEILNKTSHWDFQFREHNVELSFFQNFLSTDDFGSASLPNLYEKLQESYDQLSEIKQRNNDLGEIALNHKNEIQGLMECEDLSCETFYHSQHLELAQKIEHHHQEVKKFRLKFMQFATPLLIKKQ